MAAPWALVGMIIVCAYGNLHALRIDWEINAVTPTYLAGIKGVEELCKPGDLDCEAAIGRKLSQAE